jgi:hypothetical protein
MIINNLAKESLKGDCVGTSATLIVFSAFPKDAVIAITATDAVLMEVV